MDGKLAIEKKKRKQGDFVLTRTRTTCGIGAEMKKTGVHWKHRESAADR